MAKRVTIQEIADSLGISRNTVSKAINNSPGLSEATRIRILKRATELGYKQFSYFHETPPAWMSETESMRGEVSYADAQNREIAFFSTRFLGGSHFALPMLDQFQLELSQQGYALTMHRISAEELEQCRLPVTFHPARTTAIICAEVLVPEYARMLCRQEIPLLMVDCPMFSDGSKPGSDLLMMENDTCIHELVADLAADGIREIGFIGHSNHCRSFFERYMAFRSAMVLHDLPIREEFCINGTYQGQQYPDGDHYRLYLKERITALERLPQLFICANDYIAMDVMQIFKELGVVVPDDVMLCGFDDAPKSAYLTPALTTIRIRSKEIGSAAVELLLSRIRRPDTAFRTMYVESDLVYRESASGKGGSQ